MTFITDLEWANKISPTFRDNIEAFLPKWLESLIPYYLEGKERGMDIFHLGNFQYSGAPAEMYEHNGIAYYHCLQGSTNELAFDVGKGYRRCNWLECYCIEHPDYNTASRENIENSMYYDPYMMRVYNTKEEYNTVAKRCDAYFKDITGDADVGFSLSSTSMIYYNEKSKEYIEYWYKLS